MNTPAVALTHSLLLSLLLLVPAAPALAQKNLVCLSVDGVFDSASCSPRDGFDMSVVPAPMQRKFLWIAKRNHAIAVGIIPAGAASASIVEHVLISGTDWMVGPDGIDGKVVLSERQLGTWTFTLDSWWFREGRLSIRVPRGVYRRTLTFNGKELFKHKGEFDFLSGDATARRGTATAPRQAARATQSSIRGRALAADNAPADFAQVTADCSKPLCETDEHGSFHCALRAPLPSAICIDHPRLGRKRVDLGGRREGDIDVGDVRLLRGAVIRVVKPLHVELPDQTTVSLFRGRREIGEEQAITNRELIEIEGLDSGEYQVLLAGPQPLQRKLFPVEVTGEGEFTVALSFEPFKLTGDVTYRSKALPGAKVALEGPLWSASLETNQSGRFEAELWSAASYAVLVTGVDLSEPYGVMKRTSATDDHWLLNIPSRAIRGRITDAGTGRPVPNAAISVESDSENTRRSRRVEANEEGEFELRGIAEGQYVLTARASGFASSDDVRFTIRRDDADRQIDFPLEAGTVVGVNVRSWTGKPLPNAVVLSNLRADGTQARRVLTDAAGVARVTVRDRKPPEPIWIIPSEGSFGMGIVSADDAEGGIVVTVGEPVATLTIETRLGTGEPVPAIEFALAYEGTPLPRVALMTFAAAKGVATVTDAHGRASLPQLPAGRYQIKWAAGSRLAAAARPFEVVAGPGETKVRQVFRVAEN